MVVDREDPEVGYVDTFDTARDSAFDGMMDEKEDDEAVRLALPLSFVKRVDGCLSLTHELI